MLRVTIFITAAHKLPALSSPETSSRYEFTFRFLTTRFTAVVRNLLGLKRHTVPLAIQYVPRFSHACRLHFSTAIARTYSVVYLIASTENIDLFLDFNSGVLHRRCGNRQPSYKISLVAIFTCVLDLFNLRPDLPSAEHLLKTSLQAFFPSHLFFMQPFYYLIWN